MWNDLPAEVVEEGSILTFKSKVDRYMDGKGMEGYGLSAGRWDLGKINGRHGLEGPRGPVSVL